MNDTTKHILTAVAASAAGAVAAALITHYLTKQATVASVATGKTPLPVGATPIVETPTSTPVVATPTPAPPPQLPPSLAVQSAAAMAQMVPLQSQWTPKQV